MADTLIVGIGEFAATASPNRIASYGLGSCVGIVLYAPRARYGALAHALLPRHTENSYALRSAKYADCAVELMYRHVIESGCDTQGLVAKLAGGSAMFDDLYRQGQQGIGQRNLEAARETLDNLGIAIAGEDVGGNIGRSMIFDLESGLVTIRTLTAQDTIL